MRNGGQTLGGDLPAAADAGTEGALCDAVERGLDGAQLRLPRLAEFLQHLVVLALDGAVIVIGEPGAAEIGVDRLLERVREQQVKELILATNPTVEGEATAWYITEQVRALGVVVSRIAHGVPLGGELEFVDSGTLAHALSGRRVVE